MEGTDSVTERFLSLFMNFGNAGKTENSPMWISEEKQSSCWSIKCYYGAFSCFIETRCFIERFCKWGWKMWERVVLHLYRESERLALKLMKYACSNLVLVAISRPPLSACSRLCFLDFKLATAHFTEATIKLIKFSSFSLYLIAFYRIC